MAYSATSKRPGKINVMANADAKLSLPHVLPDALMQSAHIQFTFDFRPECYGLAIQAQIPHVLLKLIQDQHRLERLFQTVHYVGRGIDEICRRPSEVPVKRDMEICWSDYSETTVGHQKDHTAIFFQTWRVMFIPSRHGLGLAG